jgi:predicted PolB exonuclease-like 3'-5' exonuclease
MVWDLETVPDLQGYARAHNLTGKSPEEIRAAMGDDFPKLIYHSIICIGALVASRTSNGYEVQVVGAPHVGQRPEKELIESFVNKIGQLSPQLVTYNGCAFDLPVLRYRAMHEANRLAHALRDQLSLVARDRVFDVPTECRCHLPEREVLSNRFHRSSPRRVAGPVHRSWLLSLR